MLPCATLHDSVIGPLTCPPESFVTETTTVSVAAAPYVMAVHVSAGSWTRPGLEPAK